MRSKDQDWGQISKCPWNSIAAWNPAKTRYAVCGTLTHAADKVECVADRRTRFHFCEGGIHGSGDSQRCTVRLPSEREARQVLQDAQITRLSNRDRDDFLKALNSIDAKPNAALKAAARRYGKLRG